MTVYRWTEPGVASLPQADRRAHRRPDADVLLAVAALAPYPRWWTVWRTSYQVSPAGAESYHSGVARTDTASRVIVAPLAQVYAALVDREALVAWLPPDGMTARFERFDPRPGGSYRLVLTYADASGAPGKATTESDIVDAHYVDIVPDVRVVQAVDFVSDDPAFAGTMTMTWAVTAVDGGTRVDITAADVPDGISAEDHAQAFVSSLANLAEHVER